MVIWSKECGFKTNYSFSKNLSRGLVNIAAKLTNTKDVRDFFIDLVEKVHALFSSVKCLSVCRDVTSPQPTYFFSPLSQFIEPCRSDRWTAADMRLYLTHYTNCAHTLDTFKWVHVISILLNLPETVWHRSVISCYFPRGADTFGYSRDSVQCFG